MKSYSNKQIIGQLEPRKGAYFFLKINADVVNQFEHQRKTRLICHLDNQLEFQCGLNHLGDGNFFIIISKKNLKTIRKQLGDEVDFTIRQDPNPLGVDMPETLEILLEQDELIKERFDQLTLGKRRGIIHQIMRIKNIDLQISRATDLILEANLPRKKR